MLVFNVTISESSIWWCEGYTALGALSVGVGAFFSVFTGGASFIAGSGVMAGGLLKSSQCLLKHNCQPNARQGERFKGKSFGQKILILSDLNT